MNKNGRLQKRVAIITGASRGIGRAIALLFAREGASVVVNYHKAKILADEVVQTIQNTGGIAFAVQADVGNQEAVHAMVAMTVKRWGTVDILVNNAGLSLPGGPVVEAQVEDLDAMYSTNVKGVLFCSQAVIPYMKKQHYGKIVNISSVAGIGTSILPGNVLYAGTKGAVNIMTKRLALELGPYGIYVNAIAPGLIRTDMNMAHRTPDEQERFTRYFADRSMLQRVGEPQEIGTVALFLASDASSFLTGQVISVDGGRMDFITYSS
ncbi:MAG: SDR family oxidoreductase [Candidatus Bathyarchaeota archaeon]|nr:MAG: SDR family oxidoreductase [Candidatus Bathyarchaeota archaeon]